MVRMIEIGTISSRGQIVIPQSLREKMKIREGEKFIVIGENNTLIFKKMEMPSFEEITRPFREAKKKIKEEDVVDFIHKMRAKKVEK